MTFKTKYDIGQIVYLKTDCEQRQRMVTAIKVQNGGTLIYTLAEGIVESFNYEIELSDKQNILITFAHGN